MSKTQPASPFKGGEPVVHHERAARALERLGILCYDVAKPMKDCGCQETVFTNSLVGTKTGGRPIGMQIIFHFGLGVGTAFRQRDASEQEIDQELARRVGISRQAVIAIESGKYSPSLELAFRLALVFDKPIGEVFTCKSSGRETAEAESGTENK